MTCPDYSETSTQFHIYNINTEISKELMESFYSFQHIFITSNGAFTQIHVCTKNIMFEISQIEK